MKTKKFFFGIEKAAALSLLLAAAPFLFSCGGGGAEKELDSEKLERYFKDRYGAYMPAGFTVKASGGGESAMRGFSKGYYDVAFSGGGRQSFPFYVSDDGGFLIMGGSEPADVEGMEDAGVRGIKKGFLSVEGRSLPILVSRDRKKILVGEIEDISKDWTESITDKMSLDNVPFKGSPDAKVTVVEYSDFQCSYCASVAPQLSSLLSDYEGRIRIFYKQFPLPNIHPWAELASAASLCVYDQGNDKFWEFHDEVFAGQKEIGEGEAAGRFSEIAGGLGIDMAKYDECVGSEGTKQRVASDVEEGKAIGVRATPTFVVDGVVVPGADIKAIRKAIDYRLSNDKAGSEK